jgi:hypothetical protein
MQSWVKNVGNAQAKKVFAYANTLRFVPNSKVGSKGIEDIPEVSEKNCETRIENGAPILSMSPGQELSPQTRQAAASFPKIGRGEKVQLYDVSCVYYSDEYDISHGSCTTFRMFIPDPALHGIGGQEEFACDGTPILGRFSAYVTDQCQN